MNEWKCKVGWNQQAELSYLSYRVSATVPNDELGTNQNLRLLTSPSLVICRRGISLSYVHTAKRNKMNDDNVYHSLRIQITACIKLINQPVHSYSSHARDF